MVLLVAVFFLMPLALAAQSSEETSPRAIVYGGDEAYPPFEYLDEKGKPTGFHIELMRAMAREMNWKVEFHLDDWNTIYSNFRNKGQYDVVDMYFNPKRTDIADFSDPVTIVYHQLVVRKDGPEMLQLDSLAEKAILVENGSILENYLEENFRNLNLVPVASEPTALQLLSEGKCDAALVNQYAYQLMRTQGEIKNLVATGSPMLPHELAFCVHEGDSALLAEINIGLNRLKASGEFNHIYSKWFGVPDPEGLTLKESMKFIFFSLLALFIAFVVGTVWIRSLRRIVAQQTHTLQKELDEKSQAMLKLQESQAMLKDAQLLARIGSWSYDLKTKMLNWQDDIAGVQCFEVDGNQSLRPHAYIRSIHPEDKARFVEIFENAKHGRVYKSFQFRVYTREKKMAYLNMSTQPLYDESQQLIKVVGVIQDVTDQKQVEKELKNKNQELEKTNEELDRFVYSLSHDIKAPIASVSGLISLMKLDVEDEKAQLYIPKIESSIDKLQHFISDILNYSRNIRLEVQASEVNLKELIQSTFELLNYIDGAEKIRFITQVDQKEEMYSDPYRLRVIFNNILSNAIKYSDPDKTNSYIKASASIQDNWIYITVEDNGIGIDKQHLQKLFNMYYRATAQSFGAGLGLYIVKEVIDKLGGTISLDSVQGEGTTIHIRVPNMKALEKPYSAAA